MNHIFVQNMDTNAMNSNNYKDRIERYNFLVYYLG